MDAPENPPQRQRPPGSAPVELSLIGRPKALKKASEDVGEPVEAVTAMLHLPYFGLGDIATLAVTRDRILRLTLFGRVTCSRSIDEITAIRCKRGLHGPVVVISVTDGEELRFGVRGGRARGRDVIDRIASKAGVAIDSE